MSAYFLRADGFRSSEAVATLRGYSMPQTEIENETEEKEEITFDDLGLDSQTLAAVERKGFKVPSPIQVLAIPRLLNGEANIIAKARTGTGKTAAFGLPIVQTIRGNGGETVRALILEPTRELAIQTCTELQSFGDDDFPRVALLYGGASYNTQIKDLKRGADIVVGTPGRVQDHLERGTLKLDNIDYFILDEGDEMLDMGFIEDIEAIFAQANPASRILLFSATMPKPILRIAETFMGEYEICEEEGFVEEPLLIDQSYWVVREGEKIEALVRLIDIANDFYGLVFTQTKNDADTVTRLLDERGYEVAALHGDIPQGQREKILARFRNKKTRVLVATDVAARGIDITGLSHVVNYSLPYDGATYIHRIGRTGRAGSTGIAVTFVRPEETRRKLEYLKSAVRRAAKGEMNEGDIPSVEDVLAAKRTRMLQSLRVQLGLTEEMHEAENALTQTTTTNTADKNSAPLTTDDAVLLNKTIAKNADATHYDDDEIVPLTTETADVTEAATDNAILSDTTPMTAEHSSDAMQFADVTTALSDSVASDDVDTSTNNEMQRADANLTSSDTVIDDGTIQQNSADAIVVDVALPSVTTPHAFTPQLKPVDAVYMQMASELCDGQDAQAVLAGVLAAWYGKSLDKSHYGRITIQGNRNTDGKRGRRDSDNALRFDQKRLYVQLGKRDGFFARDIADYFSSLLHIPNRLIDRIEVTQNFSLVSLPIAAADRVLELCRHDSSMPHIHADTRNGNADFTGKGFSGKRNFANGRRNFDGEESPRFSDRADSDFHSNRRFDHTNSDNKKRFGNFGKREHFSNGGRFNSEERSSRFSGARGFKNNHARTNVHTPTERTGASAYKKSSKHERF